MNNANFDLENEGEQEYNYTHTHNDMEAKVSFDGYDSGDIVGVHCYSNDGEKMGYYNFRVSRPDDRTVHYQRRDDEEPPATAVAAIHSSGWVVENVDAASISDDSQNSPRSIRLINMRDELREMKQEVDSEFERTEFETVAEVVESTAVLTTEMEKIDIEDKDEYILRNMSQMVKNKPQANMMDSPEEWVYGHLKSVINPNSTRKTHYHTVCVNKMEMGRDLLLVGGIDEERYKELLSEDFNR